MSGRAYVILNEMRTWMLAVLMTVGCKADAEKRPAPEPDQKDEQRAAAISPTAAPRLPVIKGQVDPKQEEARKVRLNNTLLRLDTNGDRKVTLAELADSPIDYLKFDDPKAVDSDHDGTITVDEIDVAIDARRAASRARWEDELRR